MSWEQLSSRTVYRNRWIEVTEDRVVRPDGERGIYGVVQVRQPAVFVVAIDDADQVVLVRMTRYTTGPSLEVPAGACDDEPPLEAARRELREETGLQAREWTAIGRMNALNGICRAPEHVYLATGLTQVGDLGGRVEEGIHEVVSVPWSEALELVAGGAITDGESVAALMYADLHRRGIRPGLPGES
ncbi:NUDIX hydrolase [Allobranchiibius sp. GilTou73]|uniref:NUDIX domain-containing protein n=1 Tax=Allobranchiibius sp. GilTou73 TaxID=2904523 RepID=UPI001F1DA4C1|nr:NUDIX hydrolase [Allobranchiibius sp. GilTou73]UIJ35745.1 NUDIX hydrolase [Allobranchiibius sp. GilTou73]